ncbi:hypothetical protein ETB97_002238 [Aspergillus alliaceus]|uniref:Uncharacterized protein n=1 Tax=Petromyces alliaceus TaxID=209559 RepID=A0A8H6A496_PETAA|nr:hypothetical protein ETB97_002238 [Aspergillus burnettii]
MTTVPVDLDDDSVELSNGTGGNTIPGTPSHCSQIPTCSGKKDTIYVNRSFGDFEPMSMDGDRTHGMTKYGTKAGGQASSVAKWCSYSELRQRALKLLNA